MRLKKEIVVSIKWIKVELVYNWKFVRYKMFPIQFCNKVKCDKNYFTPFDIAELDDTTLVLVCKIDRKNNNFWYKNVTKNNKRPSEYTAAKYYDFCSSSIKQVLQNLTKK